MAIILKYPEDLSGINPNNLILKESHDINALSKKVIVPHYGAFYAESIKVYNGITLQLLVPKIDYVVFQLHPEATERSSKECYTLIQMQGDASLLSAIKIDYQAVGGEYKLSTTAIENYFQLLESDNRVIRWGDIVGIPEAFPPPSHPHSAEQDLVGLATLVNALQDLIVAITSGNDAELRSLYEYIDSVIVGGNQSYATQQEALLGISPTKVISPLTLSDVLNNTVKIPLNLKIENNYNSNKSETSDLALQLIKSPVFFINDGFKTTIPNGIVLSVNSGIVYVNGRRFTSTLTNAPLHPTNYPSALWMKIVEKKQADNKIPTITFEYKDVSIVDNYQMEMDVENIIHYIKIATLSSASSIVDNRNVVNNNYGLVYQYRGPREIIAEENYKTNTGKNYYLTSNGSAILPKISDLSIGDWVHFEKDNGSTAIITCENITTDIIKVESVKGVILSDTSLLYNSSNDIYFIWSGSYWNLIYA